MDIIKAYQAGIPIYQLAKETHHSKPFIRKQLKAAGLSIRTISQSCTKALAHIDKILSDFDSGISVSKLAKQYNYTISGMSYLIQRNGRKVLRSEDKVIRDWSFIEKQNDLFFYWLGWMISDGYINYKKTSKGFNHGITTSITVHKKDIHILEFFKDNIQSSAMIRSSGSNCRTLSINIPRNLANIVNEFGLIPNKTYKFKPTKKLNNMTDKQFLQFLCGFIEGDGTIRHQKIGASKNGIRKHLYDVLSIVFHGGGINLIGWIADKISTLGFEKRKIIIRNEKKQRWEKKPKYHITPKGWQNRRYSISGKDAVQLAKMLLECKYHLLDRKWDNARLFIK